MPKDAVFTMTLEPELRDAFAAEAAAAHRPADQIVRELMREFVERQRDARSYDDFLRRKVALARADIVAGRHRPDEAVAAEAASQWAAESGEDRRAET